MPSALGSEADRINRGMGALDAYFSSGGFHVNINVLNRETLQDAVKHPEKYPQLTIRVSGYAVNFVKLTKEQQLDVINRTFTAQCRRQAMSEPRTGSRYEIQLEAKGKAESKAVHDYFAVHPGDVEDQDEDDLVGCMHSYEVGSTVDGPGIASSASSPDACCAASTATTRTRARYNGHPVTVSRAMQQIGKYAQVLKISKGGVTLSGGEPMLRRAFVVRIFRRCKELGLHTCMDTSRSLGDKFTDPELMDIDLNLLDIKSGDPAISRRSRASLKPTLDYAQRLSHAGAPDLGPIRARGGPHRRLRQRRESGRHLCRA